MSTVQICQKQIFQDLVLQPEVSRWRSFSKAKYKAPLAQTIAELVTRSMEMYLELQHSELEVSFKMHTEVKICSWQNSLCS